tara:strand:- start:31023 stop:31301 length:279 start_codon:yes stop_codon:yes gene_type:complete
MFLEKKTNIKALSYLTLLTIILGFIIFVWGQVNYFKKTHADTNTNTLGHLLKSAQDKSVAEQVRHFITSLTIVLFFLMLLLTLYFASISYNK